MTSRLDTKAAGNGTPRRVLVNELGVTNPKRAAPTLYEDYDPKLRGARALQVYREMTESDAGVSSVLYAISLLSQEVDWRVDAPDNPTPQETAATEFLRENFEGLETPWTDFVDRSLTALPYGFSFHETVYRNDGAALMWDRFGFRPQTSLLRWVLDEGNNPVGFVQTGTPPVPIPLVKGIYWRTATDKPEGRSVLRGVYKAWYYKKFAEENLMIGLSRNLNGLPVAEMPSEILLAGPGSEPYDTIKTIIVGTKKDEQMGVLWISDRDENGHPLYTFRLESPQGDPHYDQAIAVIRNFAMDIAAGVLAQWLGFGRDAVGSRALAEPTQAVFHSALDAWLDSLEETVNRQAVRTLFQVNPQFNVERLPKLVHGEVADVDLSKLGNFLLKTAQAGAPWFTGADDDPLMTQLRDAADLPQHAEVGDVQKMLDPWLRSNRHESED